MQVFPTKAFNLALTDSVGLKVLKSFHQTQRRRKSFIGKMKFQVQTTFSGKKNNLLSLDADTKKLIFV